MDEVDYSTKANMISALGDIAEVAPELTNHTIDVMFKQATEITEDNILAALGDIAEVAPELIEYILTCYPPELMVHISPEIRCQLSEQQEKLLSSQGQEDS